MTKIKAVWCTFLAVVWRIHHPYAPKSEWDAYIESLIERYG